MILNHSSAHGRPLTFECLSGFVLPSKPNESLASILLRKLSNAGDAGDSIQLPVQFCLEVIRLWDSCRKEGCVRVTYLFPIPTSLELSFVETTFN